MTATAESASRQEFSFQAEIRQLLHILSHSLYQNREIAVRELVSNASDALDKLRHLQLTDERFRDDAPLEVVLDPRREERVLAVIDNGVGMDRDELIANLGTIAHSGSLEFLNRLSGDARRDLSLIGQFGVGFYSAFMLADRVEVLSRSCRDEQGWRWESDGTGQFTIEPADALPRGTEVRLHLKEGMEEFAEPERVRDVVRRYSTFVPHPIRVAGEQVNVERPIWVEPKGQVADEQYASFYQFLSHRVDESPLWHLHLSADSPLQFHAILYCPATNYELLGFGRVEHGLHLCARRILVQDDCRELLPEYLRFLYGLVDSADLPLNVSRETLQDNTILRKIRKVLVKRVLDHLQSLGEEQPDDYVRFYRQFGPALREGIGSDFENREKIAKLLRFPSSRADGPEGLASLDDYLGRAGDGQTQIYFLGGPDRATLEKHPGLEVFRRRGVEVLYLTDPIDELALTHLGSYEGKRLVSIDSAEAEIPEPAASDEEQSAEEKEPPSPGFERVLQVFRDARGDRVVEVRESKRLTDSPCCLVNPAGAPGVQVQKVLRMNVQDFEMPKRIFEVNPASPLIRRLSRLSANPDHDAFLRDCALQLYDNALLLEGLAPTPEETVGRIHRLLEELGAQRSPIIT